MFMICWFYCMPFAKLFYFASSALLFVFALFALKRGVRMSRLKLRQWAFVMMFIALFKTCIFDIRFAKEFIICDKKISFWLVDCSAKGYMVAEFMGLLVLMLGSIVLFHFYRIYLPNKKVKPKTPEEVSLRFWANFSLIVVTVMAGWTMAPWVGFLTVGYVPRLFELVQWQHFAILNGLLLLWGFWLVESCSWERAPSGKTRRAVNTWTPRDTLWLNVFLYAITMALSYVSHDLLTKSTAG